MNYQNYPAWAHSPPLEEGWLRLNKKSRSHRKPAADGVVAHKPPFKNAFRNMVCERPPRPLHLLRLRAIALALRAKVASRHFLDVASTPPHEASRGGECAQPNSLVIHSTFSALGLE